MRIALDYDRTYSEDPIFWRGFLKLAEAAGHEVRIVTIRDDRFDRTQPLEEVEFLLPVIYTRGIAKKWYLTHFGEGFMPDVWIDDKPETITENSACPPDVLKIWREERNEPPSTDMLINANAIAKKIAREKKEKADV